MGNVCGGSTPEDKKSLAIDRMLARQHADEEEEVKLLLLGPGESGKSTIFKQMKILQIEGGFSKDELRSYRFVVHSNAISQMKILINAVEKLHFEFDSAENKRRGENLNSVPSGGEVWNKDIANDIKILWADKGIKAAYERRNRDFQLNDSAAYFFDNVDRFMSEDYLPTHDDILRARVRTTGIEEAEFDFGDLSFRMFDVGGQRSERRKWIHCFEGVSAVIYCTALSEYDQTLREDESQNRMKESLLLFDEISNLPWFQNTAFVLFLNKTDLFKDKLAAGIDLKICFPDYKGPQAFKEATEYIQKRFIDLNRSNHNIYPHLTCAIDTDQVKVVFQAVRETLLTEVLKDIF